IFQSDNGELKHDDMRTWLLSRGTTHQFTSAYTSTHNGHRVHRTLMGKAQAM
ncbi:hypothetical protein PAXRUDRAFT_83386, partial [Paxillus rubicundulus Ve08.2h10]